MMFSRILRSQSYHKSPDTTIHSSVITFATAKEAIDYLKTSKGHRKVDVLSLDLNLKRTGGNGFDVLKVAVANGQKFATIAISGFAIDDEFRDEIGESQYRDLPSLKVKVEHITNCECIQENKFSSERFGDAREQVPRIERNLISRSSGNLIRNLANKLRNNVSDLNGQFFCMHFKLPELLFRPCPGDWVSGSVRRQRNLLNKLSVWNGIFHPLDDESTQLDLVGRLLFLVKPGNYLSAITLQDQVEEPDLKSKWQLPNQQFSGLPPSQAFLLLQLIAQGWESSSRNQSQFRPSAIEEAIVSEQPSVGTIDLSGLINPTAFGWQQKGSVHCNGESLAIARFQDGKEDGALKSRKCHLEKAMKEMLGGVEYDLIDCLEQTYALKRPGQIFIHKGT